MTPPVGMGFAVEEVEEVNMQNVRIKPGEGWRVGRKALAGWGEGGGVESMHCAGLLFDYL